MCPLITCHVQRYRGALSSLSAVLLAALTFCPSQIFSIFSRIHMDGERYQDVESRGEEVDSMGQQP